jgi:hypothetical protein
MTWSGRFNLRAMSLDTMPLTHVNGWELYDKVQSALLRVQKFAARQFYGMHVKEAFKPRITEWGDSI